MTAAITARGVSVAYNGTRVLEDVSFEVPSSHWVCVIGPNGAGKTTLVRALAGLTDFDGSITIGDVDVSVSDRRSLARMVSYVPQRPLMPLALTVTDYVLMGRTPYIPYFGTESSRDIDVVTDVLTRLELMPFSDRSLGSLSGGEAQRAVLARALAQFSPVLLLDEPTTALDVGHQQQVLEMVDVLRRESDLTVVSTMHDLTLAGQFSDTLMLLDAGRVVASGDAPSVLTEDLIGEHYAASVRVLDDGAGGMVVVPTRDRASLKRALR